MKKTLLLLFIIHCSLFIANAQVNYQISFAGTGASTTVNSVKVENLTQGSSLMLTENDVLNLTVTTGINESGIRNEESGLNIYPNPMLGYCLIDFEAPEQGEAIIGLYDLTGKRIILIQELLTKGHHKYNLKGVGSGMYVLKVKSNNYSYSAKIVSSAKAEMPLPTQLTQINLVNSDIKTQDYAAKSFKSNKSLIDMAYTTGDQLKLTGFSGINRDIVWLVPTKSQTITFYFAAGCGDVSDNCGNVYTTVQIGDQCWMKENLNIGTMVTGATTQTDNSIIEKYCYNNDPANCSVYGGMYQWDEMMQYVITEKTRGICPQGWHIPSHDEWTTLERAVCISTTCNTDYPYDNTTYGWRGSYDGGKMKSTGTKEAGTGLWNRPNTGATNSSGFTSLPGGRRTYNDGSFNSLGDYMYFWSSTESTATNAWSRYLYYYYAHAGRYFNYKTTGFSARCLKD